MHQDWKNHKSGISRKIRKYSEREDGPSKIENLRPYRLSKEEWDAFVDHRLSNEYLV